MDEIKTRKCIVCGKVFQYRTIPKRIHPGTSRISYRGKNMITCSSNCSRIYARVFDYIYSRNKK